jgi:hypothetical protein
MPNGQFIPAPQVEASDFFETVFPGTGNTQADEEEGDALHAVPARLGEKEAHGTHLRLAERGSAPGLRSQEDDSAGAEGGSRLPGVEQRASSAAGIEAAPDRRFRSKDGQEAETNCLGQGRQEGPGQVICGRRGQGRTAAEAGGAQNEVQDLEAVS